MSDIEHTDTDDTEAPDLWEELGQLDEQQAAEIARELDETQTLYEKIAYLGSPKMPCPECGGSGSVYGGSLGDICPTCHGARLVEHPAAEPLAIPDFAGMRAALGRIRGVIEGEHDRVLPGPHRVPSIKGLQAIRKLGKEFAKQLGPQPQMPQLASQDPKARTMGSLGPGHLDIDDEDLELIEAGERRGQKVRSIWLVTMSENRPGATRRRIAVIGLHADEVLARIRKDPDYGWQVVHSVERTDIEAVIGEDGTAFAEAR